MTGPHWQLASCIFPQCLPASGKVYKLSAIQYVGATLEAPYKSLSLWTKHKISQTKDDQVVADDFHRNATWHGLGVEIKEKMKQLDVDDVSPPQCRPHAEGCL